MKTIVTFSSIIAVAAAVSGCSQQPAAARPVINDKVYSVTPAALKVKSGLVAGDMSEMKVVERVEAGSGRIDSPARLQGKLVLRNTSTDQSVRLVAGKVVYIDAQGKPIKLEDTRAEPALKMSSGYGSQDRLDPGQESTQAIDVDFPVEALKAKRLKDLRVELVYIPSPYREESLTFPVAIGGQ